MAVAHSISNALTLYDAGAAYVILPHFLGGKYASTIAHKLFRKVELAEEMRDEHIKDLKIETIDLIDGEESDTNNVVQFEPKEKA